MYRSTRHRFEIALVLTAAALLLAILAAGEARGQPACDFPACRGDETYRDGDCNSKSGFPTYAKSHRIATCPEGTTLNRTTGMCISGGTCCNERTLCAKGTSYSRSGSDRDGVYGVCESSGGLGYRSHELVRCAAGWTLDTGRGVCRGECRVVVPSGRALPDLTFGSLSLRPSVLHAGMSYYLCFTVANIGAAASGPFRVGAGGLGIPYSPFQDHASLAPGATRDGCIRYPTTPPAGTYTLGAKVDSLNAVAESNEGNNERTIGVVVGP